MSLIRFGRTRDFQFFRREDIRTRWDLRSATQLLDGFRRNSVAMETLRREAMKVAGNTGKGTLSEDQVIQIIARQLVDGQLLVALPYRERNLPQIKIIEDAPSSQAPEVKKSEDRPEDEPTFDSDHDGVAQASALIAAAKGAYPFCEECMKAEREAREREGAGVA